jgi:hypothetical protein
VRWVWRRRSRRRWGPFFTPTVGLAGWQDLPLVTLTCGMPRFDPIHPAKRPRRASAPRRRDRFEERSLRASRSPRPRGCAPRGSGVRRAPRS